METGIHPTTPMPDFQALSMPSHPPAPLANSKSRPEKRQAPNQDAADLPSDDIQILEYQSVAELEALGEEWDRLVDMAIEPNVFLEPYFLKAALQHLATEKVRVLVATAPRRVWPTGPRVLCGMMPIVPVTGFEGRLGRGAKLWLHDQAFLGHPLLRSDAALATFRAMLAHLREAGYRSINLKTVPADGPFQHLLAEHLQTSHASFFVRDLHHRAVYKPAKSSDDYISRWPRSKRQSINRLTRRLSEMGTVTTRIATTMDEANAWIEQFLALESEGWKGDQGTALACHQNSRQFVQQILTGAFQRGNAMLLSLELDGQPIAMKCNLLTGNAGFAFKIAFDPSARKYSPGCLLEKANIDFLQQQTSLQFMDSCAQPNHPMIDSLWADRRLLQTITLSTGPNDVEQSGRDWRIAMLPLARWLQRRFQKSNATPSISTEPSQ